MTAALEGGEWSAARPGRTSPTGKTRYPFYRRLGGFQSRSGRAENLVPTGIRSQTVQPVVSHYTDWATRPTHICVCVCVYIYIYVCVCVYIYICVCVYIYMCVCVCIYIYVCVCVYIYICTESITRIPKSLQYFYESAVGICFYDPTFIQTFQYTNVTCST